MSGFSNALAQHVINWSLRGQAAPTVGTTYFALFTDDPTDAFSAGKEVTGAWYARQPTGAFTAPTVDGLSSNATRVPFAALTGSPVTVTHIGIVSGSSPADPSAWLMYLTALDQPKTIGLNDVYAVEPGDFSVRLI